MCCYGTGKSAVGVQVAELSVGGALHRNAVVGGDEGVEMLVAHSFNGDCCSVGLCADDGAAAGGDT